MLVTNFHFKNIVYTLTNSFFQLLGVGRFHPFVERERRALMASVDYIEKSMPGALGLITQKQSLLHSLSQVKVPGHYMEFGVFKGQTISFMARHLGAGITFHGFDSFEGLPEAWSGFYLGKSAFSLGGRLPTVPANVKLYKGWFSDTLPTWLQANEGPVAFVHIDCDIYSSTVDILEGLATRFQPGTVILFDEYFNYPGWELHEFKAWKEFVERHKVTYEYLSYARHQVALRIVSIGV